MNAFTGLVLAIPHATGRFNVSLWSDSAAVIRDARRWTDWHTDRLFQEAGSGNPHIRSVVAYVSRFDCDFERLQHDPLESIGQGRLYVRSHSGATRSIPSDLAMLWLREWGHYRTRIVEAAVDWSRPFLLDCHSFPADLAPDVDICLGWNEDTSRPHDAVLAAARAALEKHGFRVAFNRPYGNALLPDGWRGPSLLVELNKRIYLNETSLTLLANAARVTAALHDLYAALLGIPQSLEATRAV